MVKTKFKKAVSLMLAAVMSLMVLMRFVRRNNMIGFVIACHLATAPKMAQKKTEALILEPPFLWLS